MKQKHYIDIEALRETDTEFRIRNTLGFSVGDIIQITEKIDGSSACAAYDVETGEMCAFSRKQPLTFEKNLSGFWNYVQTLDKAKFAEHPNWRVFGEWSQKNKIIYDDRFRNKWIVYDIFDVESESWIPQDVVKQFCQEAGLEYIHVFYEGPFISWEHCKSFMHSPQYGETQEGIVVKNQTTLNGKASENPLYNSYLKLVNPEFAETMKPSRREVSPEEAQAKEESQNLARTIVTKNRVEKLLIKAQNEGELPARLDARDLAAVAKILPKAVYEDCMKEEKEIVLACGAGFGKFCGSLTMKYVREIVLG